MSRNRIHYFQIRISVAFGFLFPGVKFINHSVIILQLVLEHFRFGFGLVLVSILLSFVSKIYAIYLYRYMAYILRINGCKVTDISE